MLLNPSEGKQKQADLYESKTAWIKDESRMDKTDTQRNIILKNK